MLPAIAYVIVGTFCATLLLVAGAIFVRPAKAAAFLGSFATSPRVHFFEQFVRAGVGASLVVLAPRMWQPALFGVIGWCILVTAILLMILPWRWHRWFAGQVIPSVIRFRRLFAVCVVGFVVLLLYGLLAPDA